MALSPDWQEKSPHIHYCRKCGAVAEVLPANEFDDHANCGGCFGTLTSITKEQYRAMSEIEKQGILQEVKEMNERVQRRIAEERAKSLASRPHCPMCKSTDFSKITTGSRMASIFAFGLASSSIGKQYKCNKCGHKW